MCKSLLGWISAECDCAVPYRSTGIGLHRRLESVRVYPHIGLVHIQALRVGDVLQGDPRSRTT